MAEELENKERPTRVGLLTKNVINPDTYEVNTAWQEATCVEEAHSIAEIVRFAEKDPEHVEIEGSVLLAGPNGLSHVKMDTKSFVETFKTNPLTAEKFREAAARISKGSRFRESGSDSFLYDDAPALSNSGLVGDDYVPLLGGPFNKQLYYADYIRMHAYAFQQYNHHPLAKRSIQMIKQFVLGRGFRVDVNGPDKVKGLALWRALEKVNNLQAMMCNFITELCLYGETMVWELPDNQLNIQYDVKPGQEVQTGYIPRFRLIDPSVIWEIVTYPEDVNRVLYYQWVAPTQYQMYSGKDGGEDVGTTKFITQQIPADQVMHWKINAVSNEKRGRSDLFPVMGYGKRLADSIHYEILAQQKNASWCMDTTIEGSQADIDFYIQQMQAMGTIAPAASEFVHSKKVERKYNANSSSGGKGQSQSFEWAINMYAAGMGIPVSYYGTHLSGGQSRASALVATEPVAKMFEDRQQVVERAILAIAERTFEKFGYDCEVEISFPEIITQDRSAKLKDLMLCQQQGWISKERAAEIAAKELGVSDYEYTEEQKMVVKEPPAPAPLTASPAAPYQDPSLAQPDQSSQDSSSAVTSKDKRKIAMNDGA